VSSLFQGDDIVLDQLTDHKAMARRFLEEEQDADRVVAYDELCTPDYVEHDPMMPVKSMGLPEIREAYRELAMAMKLRHVVDSIIAEEDLVAARFTARGRHVGEYQGIPPSGRTFEITGQITLRFQDGKIAETWIIEDRPGILEQLGGGSASPT
jgi:predicted ester cyclase